MGSVGMFSRGPEGLRHLAFALVRGVPHSRRVRFCVHRECDVISTFAQSKYEHMGPGSFVLRVRKLRVAYPGYSPSLLLCIIMVSSTSSSQSSSPYSSSMANIPITHFVTHSVASVSNIKNFIPTTLDYKNNMIWRELFLPVFKGHGVYGFIDGSYPCPESTLTMDDGTSIQATLSQEILQAIIRPNQSLTPREAWLQIERLFHDNVSSRTLQLKVQFHNLKKGSLSIADYVRCFKSITDALTSIGNPISDFDLVLQILSGLPYEYLSVSTSISTRIPLPTFLETRSLLFLHDTQLNGFSSTASDSSTALVAKQNSSSQGSGRGRNSNGGRYAYGGWQRTQQQWLPKKLFHCSSPVCSTPKGSFHFRSSATLYYFFRLSCLSISFSYVFNPRILHEIVHLLVPKHSFQIFNLHPLRIPILLQVNLNAMLILEPLHT
uniref:Uncharacterized protein LOC104229337 n=1 Tax=Nicotiana sylvestris TaxID=4096 RepID=A0A1U7WSH8_NICSY|nr:PREDICTED: uncharacterized protein LOC104229337 [Nicotiana sylvestris]